MPITLSRSDSPNASLSGLQVPIHTCSSDFILFSLLISNVPSKLILGTTKSYLGSLVLFLDNAISQKMTNRPEARAVIEEKRMRKRVQRRRTEMETEDIGKRFTVT